MSNFANLKRTADMEASKDTLGSGYMLESDVYPCMIECAWLGTYKSGAMYLGLRLKVRKEDGTMQEYNERLCLTNKKGENYFVNKAGKKQALPGYERADDICLLSVGQQFGDLVNMPDGVVKKNIQLWNPETSQMEPTEVDAIAALTNQEVLIGILKIHENKQTADSNGNYVNTNDAKDINQIDKAFHMDYKATVAELLAARKNGTDPSDIKPEFINKWLAKHKGITVDKFKPVAESASFGGTTSFGNSNFGSANNSNKLFGRKAS